MLYCMYIYIAMDTLTLGIFLKAPACMYVCSQSKKADIEVPVALPVFIEGN